MTTRVKDFYENAYDEDSRLTKDSRHLVEFYTKSSLYARLLNNLETISTNSIGEPTERNYSFNILQISCGTGALTGVFLEDSRVNKVVSCDLIPKHIQLLNEKYSSYGEKLVSGVVDVSDVDELNNFLSEVDLKFDLVIVEGAWYHLGDAERTKLVNYITEELHPTIISIDWLSKMHEGVQQFILGNAEDRSIFHFDSPRDAYSLKFSVQNVGYPNFIVYPVDYDTRFAFRDLNEKSPEEIEELVSYFNDFRNTHYYHDSYATVNHSEHGVYLIFKDRN